MKKKSNQKSNLSGSSSQKLTPTEQEVLFLWTKQFLTKEQIAIRRQTKIRAVQKVMRNLRKKGYLDERNFEVTKRVCGINFDANKIRFHGMEFNIKILHKDKRYKEILSKTNIIEEDGNTIRLFKDAVEVYINHSFYSDAVDDARKDGFDYAFRFFSKLEKRLKILLVRQGSQNIKLVKQHFSEVNNEFAEDLNAKKEKFAIKGSDGKTWLLVDNSMNLNELETIHTDRAEQDMNKIKPFFDDLRDNPVKLSDVLKIISDLAEQNRETASGLNAVVKLLVPKKEDETDNKKDSEKKPYYVR